MAISSDPMYEKEPCWQCDGDGYLDGHDCDACDGTGLLYTQAAIKLQVDASESPPAAPVRIR